MDRVTLRELVDERARLLTQIDDVIATHKSSGRSEWLPAERLEHDTLAARADSLGVMIERGATELSGGNQAVPAANMVGAGSRAAAFGLDALLWSTAASVRAGTFGQTGEFLPDPAGATNLVEQVCVRSESFGVVIEAPRIDDIAPEAHRAVRTFQSLTADMVLWGLMIDKAARSSRDGFEAARSHRMWRERWDVAMRAMDVDTSGEGGNWVPTGIGASLHERVRAAGKIAPLFARLDLPSNPWKWPVEGSDLTAYRVPEPTTDTETKVGATTAGTVATTFDAEIFGGRMLFSRSLEADAAVAMLPFVRSKLVRAFVDAEESCILDGDTDGTHQDSDVGASTTDARTAWDGLRKKALAQTTQATTTTTAANLALIRKAMGKWGVNPSDLAFIVGVSAFYGILTDANVLTLDKMGPNATILNGQIASIYGIPIIVSEHVRENLNATGVYDGITTTKTYNLCVNRQEWVMGQRMALDVEVDDSIYRETYQRVLVGFMREDFQNIGDAATNEDTSIGYNVTP